MGLFLILLVNISLFAQVEDAGLRTRIDGFFGNLSMCQDLELSDLHQVDACVQHYTLPDITPALATMNLDNYLEDLIFNELAKRSHDATNCQVNFFDSLRSGQEGLLIDRAWEMFRSAAPRIRELSRLKARKENELSALGMAHDPMDRGPAELERQRRVREARTEIAALDQMMAAIAAEVPLGQHNLVRDAIIAHAERSGENLAPILFRSAYFNSMTQLKNSAQESQRTFQGLRQTDGLYRISREEKITFTSSGQTEALIGRMDLAPEVRQRIICRMRALYLNGPRTTGALTTIGLVGAGFATGGIASVALRGVATLGVSTAAAVDLAYAVQDQCLAHTVNLSAEDNPQCNADQFVNSLISEANFNSCATTIVLAAAPMAARFGGRLVSPLRRPEPLAPPAEVEIVTPQLRNGLFNIQRTSIYSDDAVVVGVSNNGHMYLMAGGRRFDGEPPIVRSRTRGSPLAGEGALFRINLSPERAARVRQAMEARNGTRNISCVQSACRILRENDIVIAGDRPGMRLRIRPILDGLTRGNVTAGGQAANVRMYATSQEALDNFLRNSPATFNNTRNFMIAAHGVVGGSMSFVAYEIIEEAID